MKDAARRSAQVGIAALALAALAVPPLVLAFSNTASVSADWTALRLLALYALTLLFFNVLTGAARPLFNRVFPPRTIYAIHNFTGLAAFLLALAHGLLVLGLRLDYYPGQTGYMVLGPVALGIAAAAIGAALARRRLKRAWRWLHRLNYLLFIIALTHAWLIGFDLKYGQDKLFMQLVAVVYAVMAAAAVAYRVWFQAGPRPRFRRRTGRIRR